MILYICFFIICFGASSIGAICGIGGGVIIKPTLDAFGILDVTTISFLSGCTVLAMTSYTLIKGKLSKESSIDKKIGFPLAIGSAAGGIIGKMLFGYLSDVYTDKQKLGAIQAICLLIVTIGTLLYTLNKDKVKTYRIHNAFICIAIGIILGILSSFLGIGGGPINLILLFFFFSMDTKTAAENSLYIIFFSQLASLIQSFLMNSIPNFSIEILLFMVMGGCFGGIFGHALSGKINNIVLDRLFIWIMVIMIGINVFNIYKFI